MRRVIIAGTFVSRWAAKRIYAPMAEAIGADIVALPRWGVDHTFNSVVDVYCKHIARHEGGTFELVGHSQGGVVAAQLGCMFEQVTKVVTLGAPLHGTAWSPLWAPFPAARCMAVGSRHCDDVWLDWLESDVVMHNVVSTSDRLLQPFSNGLLAGAEHHVLKAVSHTGLATTPAVISLVKECLDG